MPRDISLTRAFHYDTLVHEAAKVLRNSKIEEVYCYSSEQLEDIKKRVPYELEWELEDNFVYRIWRKKQ